MTETNIKRTSGVAAMWTCLLLFGVLVASSAGYNNDDGDDGATDYYRGHEPSGNNKPLPVILMHKQSLQQDGGFQYAFAADNGLRQGESIRPDGSRTGAYSYTDPNGKEITVKYTAGKDGFRIVQGDHVPKAPVTVVPVQQSPAVYGGPPSPGRIASGKNRLFGAPGGPGSQFSRGDSSGRYDYNSGEGFGPVPYRSKFPKAQQHYRVREENSAEQQGRYENDGSSSYDGAGDYSSHSPFRAPSAARAHGSYGGESSQNRDDDESDERQQQPHSFGNGYAFEFAGTNNNAEASSGEF